jgi:hypothetical protein
MRYQNSLEIHRLEFSLFPVLICQPMVKTWSLTLGLSLSVMSRSINPPTQASPTSEHCNLPSFQIGAETKRSTCAVQNDISISIPCKRVSCAHAPVERGEEHRVSTLRPAGFPEFTAYAVHVRPSLCNFLLLPSDFPEIVKHQLVSRARNLFQQSRTQVLLI